MGTSLTAMLGCDRAQANHCKLWNWDWRRIDVHHPSRAARPSCSNSLSSSRTPEIPTAPPALAAGCGLTWRNAGMVPAEVVISNLAGEGDRSLCILPHGEPLPSWSSQASSAVQDRLSRKTSPSAKRRTRRWRGASTFPCSLRFLRVRMRRSPASSTQRTA
jgi:hypothetical protein